jgi:hypothetical protein
MRELTMAELELVSGGLETVDGDGIWDGVDGGGDGGWDGWWDGGQDGGDGGGGGGGGGHSSASFGVTDANTSDLQSLDAALAYLDGSPLAQAVLNDAMAKGAVIHIVHNGDDHAEIGGDEVWWDPSVGLRTSSGATQSAALNLIHDLSHLFGSAADPNEEQRVIANFETPIANALGEPTRADGSGVHVVTPNPTYHT